MTEGQQKPPESEGSPVGGATHGAEEPLASRLVRGGLWAAGASWFSLVVGFAANLWLMNILAPEDYGVFALGFSFYAILGIRGKLGIAQAFGQSRDDGLARLAGTFLKLNIGFGILTIAICLAAVPILAAAGYGREVLSVMVVMSGVGVLEALGELPGIVLGRRLMFRAPAVISAVVFPLSYVPAFLVAWHGGRHWSIVTQGAVLAVGQAALLWLVLRRQVPDFGRFDWRLDRASARSLLRFGTVTGLASIVHTVTSALSGVIIGTFSAIREAGLYNRSIRFARWPAVVLDGVLSGAAFFTYSHLQQERERLGRAFTMLLWVITAVAGPIAVGMFVSAPELVRVLLKPDWEPCIPLIRIAVVYLVFTPFVSNIDSLFLGVGHPRVVLAANVVELVLFASLGVPFTIKAGALGACAAAGISRALSLLVRVAWARRFVTFSATLELLLPAACALFAILLVMAVNRYTGINDWPAVARLLAKAAMGVACFYAALFAARPAQTIVRVRYLSDRLRERRKGGDAAAAGRAAEDTCE